VNLEYLLGFQDDIHKSRTIHSEIFHKQTRFRHVAGIFGANVRPEQIKEGLADLIATHREFLSSLNFRTRAICPTLKDPASFFHPAWIDANVRRTKKLVVGHIVGVKMTHTVQVEHTCS
jgi:hypothetical protein